jgi:hypothetical protein
MSYHSLIDPMYYFAVGAKQINNANIGLKWLNLFELTCSFRNVLVFCHFFLEKKVTKNSRLCRNLPDFAWSLRRKRKKLALNRRKGLRL